MKAEKIPDLIKVYEKQYGKLVKVTLELIDERNERTRIHLYEKDNTFYVDVEFSGFAGDEGGE